MLNVSLMIFSPTIMEKLPIHSKEAFGGTFDLNQSDRQTRPTAAIYFRRICIAVVFLVGYYLLLLKPSNIGCTSPGHHNTHLPSGSFTEVKDIHDENNELSNMGSFDPGTRNALAQTKIPLEAHIMSKCPDAQACLHKLVLPAMEQISDKVDFKLSFIAR
jgi:hypothetical protein